jgi:hypothetical protein
VDSEATDLDRARSIVASRSSTHKRRCTGTLLLLLASDNVGSRRLSYVHRG